MSEIRTSRSSNIGQKEYPSENIEELILRSTFLKKGMGTTEVLKGKWGWNVGQSKARTT